MILNGLAILAMAYSGCNVVVAVFFLTFSLCMHGAVSTGVLASIVDISPNYASISLGIVSTFACMTGFVSPLVVGYITYENQSVEAWKHIFQICAAMLIVLGVIYILFNDASLQSWNNPKGKKANKEMMPLKTGDKDEGENGEIK